MTLTPLTRAIAKINEAHDEEVVLDRIGFASAAWLVLAQLDQALNEFDLTEDQRAFLEGHREAFALATVETMESGR